MPLLALPLAPPAFPMSIGDWLSTRREHMQAPMTSCMASIVALSPLLMDSKNSSAALRPTLKFKLTGSVAMMYMDGSGSTSRSSRTS